MRVTRNAQGHPERQEHRLERLVEHADDQGQTQHRSRHHGHRTDSTRKAEVTGRRGSDSRWFPSIMARSAPNLLQCPAGPLTFSVASRPPRRERRGRPAGGPPHYPKPTSRARKGGCDTCAHPRGTLALRQRSGLCDHRRREDARPDPKDVYIAGAGFLADPNVYQAGPLSIDGCSGRRDGGPGSSWRSAAPCR